MEMSLKIPTADLRHPIPTTPANTDNAATQTTPQSRPSSPLQKGAFERLDSFRTTSDKAEHSPAVRNFQSSLAGGLDAAVTARFDKKIDTAKSFDDFARLFDAGGIAGLKPGVQQALFPKATFGLVMKLGKELGTTAPAERADILKSSVTGIARVPVENFRSIGMTTAASKLNLVPAEQHQAVFDHIHETLKPLSPETRGKGLESLAAQIFRSLPTGPVDRSAESIERGRANLKKVLAGTEGLDDSKKMPVLRNLANVSQMFALDKGDWKSPFGELVNGMNELSGAPQAELRKVIEHSLGELEKAGITGVADARNEWGLGNASVQ